MEKGGKEKWWDETKWNEDEMRIAIVINGNK